MTFTRSTLFLVGTCSAVLLAGGPSAASPRVNSNHLPAVRQLLRHGWISPAAKKAKLTYVSDYSSSIILIYQQGQETAGPIGEIVNGISSPQGIAVDKLGTLYVANQGNNTITEYLAGSTDPSVTLSDGLNHPLSVSVDKNGNLYVGESSASMILEFKPGSTSPDVTINVMHPSQLTNAKNGTLYATYNQSFSSAGGHVLSCKALKAKCHDLGITQAFSQGIALDSQGNLLMGDVLNSVINIYAPGQTTPFRTITTTLQEPGNFAFTSDDSTLYMADSANFAIELYNYSTGVQSGSFGFGLDELQSVALFPGQKPAK